MSILNTPEYDQNEESSFPCDRKRLIMAIILLSMVVFFIILIQIYARWFVRRHLNIILQSPQTNFSDEYGVDEGAFSKGLDSKTIASLPKFVYEKKDASSSSECVVCLSGVEEGETIRVLKRCKHMFHVECIDMWLWSHSTCPICRGPVELAIEDSIQPQTVISVADEEEEEVVVVMEDDVTIEDQDIVTVVKEETDNSVTIVISNEPETLSPYESTLSSSSMPSSSCSCSLKNFVNRVLTSVQVD